LTLAVAGIPDRGEHGVEHPADGPSLGDVTETPEIVEEIRG